MCGFLNLFSDSQKQLDPATIAKLEKGWHAINHRGPDDSSCKEGAGWWMGFKRLSILDLTDHGRQPMSFGENLTLTFNGEIYNYQDLKEQYIQDDLGSTGDTAVLGTLLQRMEPEKVLNSLRGMFAFCLWDKDKRQLIAARDQFGIKPLYYLETSAGLLVASELKAMLPFLDSADLLSNRAVAQFFRWGAVQGPKTILSKVKMLLPGEFLIWKDGTITLKKYFVPQWTNENSNLSFEESAKNLREGVIESVKTHLISDVPVGVFLSGGLDSNIMAACMNEAGVSDIQAFSIGYEAGSGVPNESDVARKSAEYFGAEFHEARYDSNSLSECFDHYIESLDQPTGDAFNTYLVSKLAASEVKVALSGLGADEWFGGYNYMRFIHLVMQSPKLLRYLQKGVGLVTKGIHDRLPMEIQGQKMVRLAAYLSGVYGSDVYHLHEESKTIVSDTKIRQVLAEGRWEEGLSNKVMADHWRDRGGGNWAKSLFLLETESYLQNTLLRDCDSMSMTHSLELRVPLVDLEIQKLSSSLNSKHMLGASSGKTVLREAFKNDLPEWIVNDRNKKTFTLPLMKWLRSNTWRERVRDTMSSTSVKERGILNPSMVEKTLNEYYSSEVDSKAAWKKSQAVWQMFVLSAWVDRHLG